MNSAKHGLAGLAIAVVMAAASPALALPPEYYGHYNQTSPTFDPICGGASVCGPIAAMNSLVFLQASRPDLYHDFLVVDPVETATKLADYMGCNCDLGTDIRPFISGKAAYIEQMAPGVTRYNDHKRPGIDVLAKALARGADVELLVQTYSGGKRTAGHFVTLYAVDTVNHTLSFIDPTGTSTDDEGADEVTTPYNDTSGFLDVSEYMPGGRVDWEVSETPVPEPAAWALMILGFGTAGAGLRRRAFQAAGKA